MMSDKDDLLDNNEALLKSLESIKSLLAKSETKLSAARESLHMANQGTAMKKTEPEINIPTLDEVVESDQQFEIGLPDEDDIPVLESIEEEAPVFKLDDDEDELEFGESTMTIDTSSLPFDEEDSLEDISIPTVEPKSYKESVPELTPTQTTQPIETEVVVLPDLTPILSAIDDVEGTMRTQISETAIAFEEKLNNQLDAQMRKLREEIQSIVDKFGE